LSCRYPSGYTKNFSLPKEERNFVGVTSKGIEEEAKIYNLTRRQSFSDLSDSNNTTIICRITGRVEDIVKECSYVIVFIPVTYMSIEVV
jgi:uncharacterized protein (UPF0333 family)